ncbi:PREDICTED: uncharacterized protein LOC104800186 [Tarenaya hassleriana]|uniref:uncharacterized protein LOC104800186 n=1 Tax=Tarenaya hassleriana TaxID=28532 RepID=UPI00053C287C|nr:PREDICTED: uncharacterized protein LOC104800186 [Tarenaya hassleriana]
MALTMKKTCNVMAIMAMIMMVMAVEMGHCNTETVEKCVTHCVPNVCMRISKHATDKLCERPCTELCLHPNRQKDYIMPPIGGNPPEGFLSFFCKYISCH